MKFIIQCRNTFVHYIIGIYLRILKSAFLLFILDEKGEKASEKDEKVQTNIQEDVKHGQTSTKYLFTKYKPDVDSHGTHVHFTLRLKREKINLLSL